jgi:hypothetical protein
MRGSRTVAIVALGLLGGLFLVVAELSTVASVEIPGRTCREVADVRAVDRCELSGMERHGGALLLLGVVAGLMAVGAGRGRSRPAAAALVGIGVIALALAIVGDLPEANEAGAVGVTYEGATGKAGPGLYVEMAGGVLLAAAGALGLSSRRKASRPADGDRR